MLVHDKYIACYEGKNGLTAAAPDTTDTANDDDNDFTAFLNISVTNHIGSWTSELEEYLQKPVENIKEPLKWWVANCHIYPNLHCIALDCLSIPGKQFITLIFIYITNTFPIAISTVVRCVFSQGCQLLSFTHNHLSVSSI